MPNTEAASYIATMPLSTTLTEQVKAVLVEVFGKWDARKLATQHPSTLLLELHGKFWGLNIVGIIAAMQNHLEQNLQGTLINFVTRDLVKEGEPDKFGMNLVFSQLPDLVIRAGLWGTLTRRLEIYGSGHLRHEQDYLEQLFQDELPRNMQEIIADYERALDDKDPVAHDVTVLMTNDKAMALRARCGGGIRHRESWGEPNYEELVRTHLASHDVPEKCFELDNLRINKRLFCRLSIVGDYNTATNCLAVDGGEVVGSYNTVDVIVSPNSTFKSRGVGNRIRVRNWPWKTIAEDLRLT